MKASREAERLRKYLAAKAMGIFTGKDDEDWAEEEEEDDAGPTRLAFLFRFNSSSM